MKKLDRKRALKLRFRRQLRLQKMQVEELGAQAEQRLEDDFFMRLERLSVVRRFVVTWVLLVVLLAGVVAAQARSLNGYYQVLGPAPGGTYTEGILGSYNNANPIYATDLVDASVSRLIFAGLLTYNSQNQLVGDLASKWTVDTQGTTYTVTLRPNLTWQDGTPLTAADVAFTYHVIQNPDARSPLYDSWQGITVTAVNASTVTFKLPNPLASFPDSLTTGIIPEHILGQVAMADMRSVSFNSTQPVGAGPFQWQAIELTGGTSDNQQEKIALKAFNNYHAGKPKLNSFVVRTFQNQDQLIGSFKNQELTAMAGLTDVPKGMNYADGVHIYNLPLTAAVMTFFRTQDGTLADTKVRQALVAAADTGSIIANLPYPARAVREPLLRGQLAYDPRYEQSAYNPVAAGQLLEASGWKVGKDGLRYKDGNPLTFNLYYLDSAEYSQVAHELAKQWRAVGVDVQLTPQNDIDFQGTLARAPSPGNYTYDALLYGISIGADPDVYVYWDSAAIDLRSPIRLNFSEYKSSTADESLEAGRTRLDPALRAIKYRPFLQAWQSDAPALGLYQPRFLYITHTTVYGLDEKPINQDSGRFRNVQNWEIRETWQTQ